MWSSLGPGRAGCCKTGTPAEGTEHNNAFKVEFVSRRMQEEIIKAIIKHDEIARVFLKHNKAEDSRL